MLKMKAVILFSILPIILKASGQTACGIPICSCFSFTVTDCRYQNLYKLPIFELSESYNVITILLEYNKITNIYEHDFDYNRWPSLYEINLKSNENLNCSSLVNIGRRITIYSDCESSTKDYLLSTSTHGETVTPTALPNVMTTIDKISIHSSSKTEDPMTPMDKIPTENATFSPVITTNEPTSASDYSTMILPTEHLPIKTTFNMTINPWTITENVQTEKSTLEPIDRITPSGIHVHDIGTLAAVFISVIITMFVGASMVACVICCAKCAKYRRSIRTIENNIYQSTVDDLFSMHSLDLFPVVEAQENESTV
jgi:hypothetical protein